MKKEAAVPMIVILKKHPDEKQLNNLMAWLKSLNIDIHPSEGATHLVLGLVGDTSMVDIDLVAGAGHRRGRQAHAGALQERQPQVPRGGHGHRRAGRKIGGGEFPDDRRPLLGGNEEQIS